MENTTEIKHKNNELSNTKMEDERKNKMTHFVVSQTNYSFEEAENMLKKFNYDSIKVIKNYLNPNPVVKKEKPKTLNQKILGECRRVCDDIAQEGLRKKRQKELMEQMYFNQQLKNSTGD
tara:strand:+ start:844 stop:1203 length:360 start_codon:yes stop_codon:yes gene_type:complete